MAELPLAGKTTSSRPTEEFFAELADLDEHITEVDVYLDFLRKKRRNLIRANRVDVLYCTEDHLP
jgi:hypothetical protein